MRKKMLFLVVALAAVAALALGPRRGRWIVRLPHLYDLCRWLPVLRELHVHRPRSFRHPGLRGERLPAWHLIPIG